MKQNSEINFYSQSLGIVFSLLDSRLAAVTTDRIRRPRAPRRNYTAAFKRQVCEQVASGARRPSDICREHLLKEAVLLRWRKEHEKHGELAFAPRNIPGK